MIKITVSEGDNFIFREYDFEDDKHYSHPWEVTIPEMIDKLREDDVSRF